MIALIRQGYGRFIRGHFLRGVIILASGTALGQILMVLASPILTRVFSPADFGALASFTAVTAVLGVLASWRYELAVVLPEDEAVAVGVFSLAVLISVGMSLVLAAIVIPLGPAIAELIDDGTSASWLALVPLSLLAVGFSQVLNYWMTRHKAYKRLATSRFLQSVATISIQLLLGGPAGCGALGLIWGQLLGQVCAALVLFWEVWKADAKAFFEAANRQGLALAANKYRKFPQYAVPNGLLNIASQQLPGILFPALFGAYELGLFYLAQRMFSIPVSFLGQAFEQVFYQRASEQKSSTAALSQLVSQSYRSLSLIVCGPALALFVLAPSVFGYVFGPEWAEAGVYLRYLLPWMAMKFVVAPSTAMFAILNKQDASLWYELVLFLSRLAVMLIGAKVLHSVTLTLAMYGGVGVLANGYLVVKIRRLLREAAGGV